MRNIKAGCKAKIIKSSAGNEGAIVRVIKRVERYKDGCDICSVYGERWEVDAFFNTNQGNKVNHLGEKQLQIIDDYDGNEKIEWEEIKDIFVPSPITA